jgi:FG-GAP-like repeat
MAAAALLLSLFANADVEGFPLRELPRTYLIGRQALQVLDFDGDGHLDVFSGSGRMIAYGRGDGSLEEPVSLPLGTVSALRAADLDIDGRPDLVHVDPSSPLMFRRNLGGRRFAEPVAIYANPERSSQFTLADIIGNAAPDVLLWRPQRTALLLKNDGRGTSFTALETVIDPVYAIAPADLDGDGDTDLVTSFPNARLTMFYNEGAGNFTRREHGGIEAYGFAIADFDGDRAADVVAVPAGEKRVQLLYDGMPNGGSLQFEFVTAGAFPADVNGDGATDLVVSGRGADVRDGLHTAVLLNDGQGGLRRGTNMYGVTELLAIADMNEDGVPDLVGGTRSHEVAVIPGNGDGTFRLPYEVESGLPKGTLVATADGDGDGIDELLMEQSSFLFVGTLQRNGAYRYERLGYYSLYDSSVQTPDLDGDGREEIVVSRSYYGFLSIFTHSASGWTETQKTTDAMDSFLTADVTGDGVQEIVTVEENGFGRKVNVYSRTGVLLSSTLVALDYDDGLASRVNVEASDLDADGDQDLLVVVSAAFPVFLHDYRDPQPRGAVLVLRALGDGGFHVTAVLRDASIYGNRITDLDGDGRVDVGIEYYDPFVPREAFANNGDGTFRRMNGTFAWPSTVAERFDFNLDGLADERIRNTVHYASPSGPPRVVSYLHELFAGTIPVRRSRHEPPVLMKTTGGTGNFLILTLGRDPVRRRGARH